MGTGAGRQCRTRLLYQAAKLGNARAIVADQHLAGLEPRKLAGKIAQAH